MKDIDSKQVIASHKVGFFKRLEITDKGVRKGRISIPYNLIRECSIHRGLSWIPKECSIKYVDQSGRDRRIKFGGRVVEVCRDIIQASKKRGHTMSWEPQPEIVKIKNRWKHLGIGSEFLEPDFEHNNQTKDDWQMDLGGLILSGANINTVKVREFGRKVSTQYGYTADIRYNIEFDFQAQRVPTTSCSGKPVKKFPRKMVDYQWQGTAFGRILNEDSQLREMLVKSKMPPMRIEGRRILIDYNENLLSPDIFQCIERIAEHVRKETS